VLESLVAGFPWSDAQRRHRMSLGEEKGLRPSDRLTATCRTRLIHSNRLKKSRQTRSQVMLPPREVEKYLGQRSEAPNRSTKTKYGSLS
jgi:hypothetical protein